MTWSVFRARVDATVLWVAGVFLALTAVVGVVRGWFSTPDKHVDVAVNYGEVTLPPIVFGATVPTFCAKIPDDPVAANWWLYNHASQQLCGYSEVRFYWQLEIVNDGLQAVDKVILNYPYDVTRGYVLVSRSKPFTDPSNLHRAPAPIDPLTEVAEKTDHLFGRAGERLTLFGLNRNERVYITVWTPQAPLDERQYDWTADVNGGDSDVHLVPLGMRSDIFLLKHPLQFVAFVLLFVFGFAYGVPSLRKYARSDARQQSIASASLLDEYASIYNTCRKALSVVDPPVNVARMLLSEIANLARTIDGAQEAYHANLMCFHKTKPADAVLRFSSTGSTEGFLVLDQELSSVSRRPLEWDGSLQSMALAIPSDVRSSDGRWLVLPGAPKAYVTREASHVPDTSKLRSWCDQEGQLPARAVDDIVAYFKTAGIGGFASKRLAVDGDQSEWVLNVHRTSPGLLEGQERAFLALVAPLEHLLLQVLERHDPGNRVKGGG